jgi:hypothetical protein
VNVKQSVSTCVDVANNEMSPANPIDVNAISEMPRNRDLLNELGLSTFLDCNRQSVVTLLRDLEMYFESKKVPGGLKLPLVLRAIKYPFTQNWIMSAYQKIDSYQSSKQFSKLFWNELEQSRVRCDIYQRKYSRNVSESVNDHCQVL